jgi:hypothetical protein
MDQVSLGLGHWDQVSLGLGHWDQVSLGLGHWDQEFAWLFGEGYLSDLKKFLAKKGLVRIHNDNILGF